MAAPANVRSLIDSAQHQQSTLSVPSEVTNIPTTLRRDGLPAGPCNYRDLSAGPRPPGCGCRRFWLGPAVGLLGLDTPSSQAPWCACGHHACFHDKEELSKRQDGATEPSNIAKKGSNKHRDASASRTTAAASRTWHEQHVSPVQLLNQTLLQQHPAPGCGHSGLPSIPSFHLTSSELHGHTKCNGSIGLGLDFSRRLHSTNIDSESPTVADVDDLPGTDPVPSTRQASTENQASPSGAFMRHIVDQRRLTAQVEPIHEEKLAAALGSGNVIESVTEVATPNVAAVPTLCSSDHLVRCATDLINDLERGVTAVVKAQTQNSQQSSANHRLDPVLRNEAEDPTSTLTQTTQDAIAEIPNTLRRLVPLLNSLRNEISRSLDISVHESINSLVKRLDALENVSFHQIPPEHIHEQLQHLDVRLLDLESKLDEHSRLISALDLDVSNQQAKDRNKRALNETASFVSDASGKSLGSVTSSALIATAIDRVEAAKRLKDVECRLDILEAIQMPSTSMPWEVEVVLLPWGRNLRGIWYDFADIVKPGMTQEDDDWTITMAGRNVSRASLTFAESGWSDRAIDHWASRDQGKLYPKASGVNSIVYHRLKSRGLVRSMTLTSPGARDLINSAVKAFGSLLYDMSQAKDENAMDDGNEEGLLGFTSPFIPLRKVHKSSCLKFLTDAELVSPSLWNAEFLASGVLMRAPGGQKRLFVTTQEGYKQDGWDGWTWSSLRQLPRIHDLRKERLSDQDVPEADALEPCWKYHHAIDEIESVQTPSYKIDRTGRKRSRSASHFSFVASDTSQNMQRDMTPSRTFNHPITPTSEFPPTQASSNYRRKLSAFSTSLSDAAHSGRAFVNSVPQLTRPTSQQSKRRIRSFEQIANPSLIAALPSFVPSAVKGSHRSISARIKKRRRVARSKSTSSAEFANQTPSHLDVQSLHPEVDPEQVLRHLRDVIPSGGAIKPLSHFEPKTKSGSKRHSVSLEQDAVQVRANGGNEKRGVTPSAYATPYSGTITGVGDFEDEYMPSESGEDDWGGVDEDRISSDTNEHEIDDDMSVDESSAPDELDDYNTNEDEPDPLLDGDDEWSSSEDELQFG
ncbi:uncharacterized protein PV09_05642 [Verruconis gallopava]|uniref:Uncharacterized protein n=1 Tax=Verruconis gallopava TaxID=253628 RepID=A0A0D1XKX6_9PEZI|nr:uncharacterized protein PV09_05642 [Verruconis gallopava]KIW02981.1 hypothetical protein PV09_05642 [Verruconis gallopava]